MTRRIARTLDLVADPLLIAEYQRWHAPGAVWPEVTCHLRSTGILSMEIWALGSRLFMILEVSEDYPRPLEEPARVKEWERRMSEFQRPVAQAAPGEKWTDLERIFTLDAPGEAS